MSTMSLYRKQSIRALFAKPLKPSNTYDMVVSQAEANVFGYAVRDGVKCDWHSKAESHDHQCTFSTILTNKNGDTIKFTIDAHRLLSECVYLLAEMIIEYAFSFTWTAGRKEMIVDDIKDAIMNEDEFEMIENYTKKHTI